MTARPAEETPDRAPAPRRMGTATDASDAPEPNLYVAWYEAWRGEQEARRAAEAAAALRLRRELRWMAAFLVGWAVAAAVAGGAVLLLWTAA